jgi:hemoglobin
MFAYIDLMDAEEAFGGVRALHPTDLTGSRDKLFAFLSGWSGGPPLYVQKFGHPRLRARHLPFSIGEAERDAWIACMERAMEDEGLDARLRFSLRQTFFQIADFMRNREG